MPVEVQSDYMPDYLFQGKGKPAFTLVEGETKVDNPFEAKILETTTMWVGLPEDVVGTEEESSL